MDGAPAADLSSLADSLVGPLRAGGRPVARVSGGDFLRSASVRLEHGRADPPSYLQREVLTALPGHRPVPAVTMGSSAGLGHPRGCASDAGGGVLLVDGTFLLDGDLTFDLAVHLAFTPATLARRTTAELQWTLPAYAGYDGGQRADVVVRLGDVAHPAVLVRRR